MTQTRPRNLLMVHVLGIFAVGMGLAAGQAASGPATGQKARAKQAWEWTIDEKLAARYEPVALEKRRELQRIRTRGAAVFPPNADFVDGKSNPELLLPWEIFNTLMRSAFSDNLEASAMSRRLFEEKASKMGLKIDATFWNELARISEPFLEERRKEILEKEQGPLPRPLCAIRAEVIANARSLFGADFDRFLYQVVAPDMSMLWTYGPEQLRFIEGGCK